MRIGSITLWTSALLLAAGTARAQSPRDTLPERVVKRVVTAFNNHDVAAIYVEVNPFYTHENMRTAVGPQQLPREMMRDSLVLYFRRVPDAREKVSKRIVNGPLVTDLYTVRENGKKAKRLAIYEVRGGKIVRQWGY